MSIKEHLPVAIGIKFIKKANMWVFFKSFNYKGVTDTHEFFGTHEEAQLRLNKEQNG